MDVPTVVEASREGRTVVDMSSAPDEDWQPQCRICLDTEGRDLIAPCKCKGSSKWVHRDCLDKWRSTKKGTAFSACTECKAKFSMRVVKHPDAVARQWRFRALVTRDLIGIFALVQLMIGLLAVALHYLDIIDGGWLIAVLPAYFSSHENTGYYVWGLAAFFAVLGCMGCVGCMTGRGRGELDCGECLVGGPGQVGCLDSLWFCTDCSACAECAGAMGSGLEGAPILVGIAIVAVVVFAVVGVFYGVAVAAVMCQRVCQNHVHVLAKRMLTQEYVVVDLAGEDDVEGGGGGVGGAAMAPEHIQRLVDRGLM